jgi:hypothetical protein
MMFMFELAALVALGVVILMVVTTKKRSISAEGLMAQRVEAYKATLRREGGIFDKMSDLELTDVLTATARTMRSQAERRWIMLVGGAALGFFAAIFVGTQQGTQGFVLTLVGSAAVLYGLHQYVGRRLRDVAERQGLDPDRLLVD